MPDGKLAWADMAEDALMVACGEEFCRLKSEGVELNLRMDSWFAMGLMGLVQLALRHPEVKQEYPAALPIGQQLYRTLIEALGEDSPLSELGRRGWIGVEGWEKAEIN